VSRVDDDRDEARARARRAEQRRADEARVARKAAEATSFSRLVAQQQGQARTEPQHGAGPAAIAQVLQDAELQQAHGDEQALAGEEERLAQSQGHEAERRQTLGERSIEEKAREGSRHEGHAGQQRAGEVAQAQDTARQGRQGDSALAGRGRDSRDDGERLGERYEERREAQAGQGRLGRSASAPGGREEPATDARGGDGGQGGGSKDQQPGGGGSPGFRLNPALLAPVPVARARDTSGSDRLRAIANELAQKIVERVRIGANAAGRMEFQVDLRSDVLKGLTVKVSAQGGKITAVFSGSDREVLRLVEAHGESLRAALSARGLTLDEFRTEARP
jgi:hypothetical protein